MHGNVAGCWAMHGNVAGCWATHVMLRFQAMDGDMYSKVREAYMSVAQIQLDTWALIRADFEDLREQASLVRVCGRGWATGLVYVKVVVWGGVAVCGSGHVWEWQVMLISSR